MYIDAIIKRLMPKSGNRGMADMPITTGIAILYELAIHISGYILTTNPTKGDGFEGGTGSARALELKNAGDQCGWSSLR